MALERALAHSGSKVQAVTQGLNSTGPNPMLQLRAPDQDFARKC